MSFYSQLFPESDWICDKEGVPESLIMHRLKGSELRIATFPGLIPGTNKICGLFILFRSQDDSMNMEVSVPLDIEIMKSMIKITVQLCKDAPITHAKFLDNLLRWFQGKQTKRLRADNDEQEEKQKDTKEEEKTECCVCCDNDADTIALPCGHRVVCHRCSQSLGDDENQKSNCVLCRQPISHVAYPNNEMKPVS